MSEPLAATVSPVALMVKSKLPATYNPVLVGVTALVVPKASDSDHDGANDLALVITAKARGIPRAETETLMLRSVASGMVPDLAAIGTRVGTLERSARRDLESSTARALRARVRGVP